MVNKFGVHVGEGCAASGPAQKKTAVASITDRIDTVRVRMKFSFSGATVYQTAAASVKLPITPCSGRRGDLASASRDREVFVRTMPRADL
jgi:hypothetical protein